MKNFEAKFENFKNALSRLKEAVNAYEENDEFINDCIIQRFEFTYELSHKMLKKYMEEQGINFEVSFPKTVIKEAYANHLINNEQVWLNMLNDRNTTSHMYDKKIADRIVKNIMESYIEEFDNLLNNF